jgi:hypothetical protein
MLAELGRERPLRQVVLHRACVQVGYDQQCGWSTDSAGSGSSELSGPLSPEGASGSAAEGLDVGADGNAQLVRKHMPRW